MKYVKYWLIIIIAFCLLGHLILALTGHNYYVNKIRETGDISIIWTGPPPDDNCSIEEYCDK